MARCIALAVAWLMAAQAQAESAAKAAPTSAVSIAPAPQVAGIAADMTLDAARAAAPTVQWQTHLSPYTGKPMAIWADAAFTLEGQPYRVTLDPRPSGNAYLKLRSDEHVDKTKTCRARVIALAAHFDTYFAEMKAPYSPLDAPRTAGYTTSYNRLPGGAGYVSVTPNIVDDGRDVDTIEAGRNAKIREIEYDDNSEMEWATGQRAKDDYPYALDLSATFHPGDEALPSVCHIEATVTRYPGDRTWPGRPSFEMLDTAKNKLTQKPSMALLHTSLDGVELPPEGVSLAYRCEVDRANGRVLYCMPHERKYGEAKLERAARMRYTAMGFDPTGLDPDNDRPLKTDITIKLLASERLKSETPKTGGLPAIPALSSPGPTPSWTRVPTGDELSRHYPTEALSKGIEARVMATCRIAEDLSLMCTSFEIDPPEHTMFEAAAKRILTLYRANSKLGDGKDAVGATVRVPIRFELVP